MTAFRLHFVDLTRVLQQHVEDVAIKSYAVKLIPDDTYQIIISSTATPSSEKVARLLGGIHKSITSEGRLLERFVEVLRQFGSYLELMGNRMESTYRELEWKATFMDCIHEMSVAIEYN